jgi:uncharacterized protein (DUF427 family)
MTENHPRFELPAIWQPTERWIHTSFNGETIASSKQVMLMIENDRELDYYFPQADTQQEYLQPSEYQEESAARGLRRFWHVVVGDKTARNAAWTYETTPDRPEFEGFIAFKWSAMTHWFEENEEVYLEPRNPYHRADLIPSTRHVVVEVDGITIAATRASFLVFETSNPIRFYFPPEDVDQQYLLETEDLSRCQYKGLAGYYSLVVNGETYTNVAWRYHQPLPESSRLKDKIAFWPQKDPRIKLFVDGELYKARKGSRPPVS